MKKIYLFTVLLGALSLAACDPVEDDYKNNASEVTSPEQIKATVTIETQNGKNVNKVHVNADGNSFPVYLSNGVNTTYSTDAEFILFHTGENSIYINAQNTDGTVLTKEMTVTVDEMYYEVDPAYELLFGTGEKVWKWAESNCLGNGGWRETQQGPEWWILSAADVEGQEATEGGSATMTFTLLGKKIEFSNGKSGTIDFTTGGACFDSWYGTFSSTCGVLCGKSFNDTYIGKGSIIKDYQLVSLSENQLILGWSEDENNSEWSTGWWWVFEAQ